ncbi:hypothetical protein AMATHDRAFT_73975 [Amanita thiersii Skay4041]|uniref:Uncharacterized protein n=1 Tax=Amanita thiersii Skay4041 TaxID=703135 RepID=A0A2A9NYE8_9AGAR|nr:hypothetical protein AMATHDRAFT_73975 [Amanita thiersii Skay4041]
MDSHLVRASPPSPTRRRQQAPTGFRPSPRPKRPIADMTIRELRDLHTLNARILASPDASTSTYVQRVSAEQAAIESRLLELEGVESIRTRLRTTQIKGEDEMNVDIQPETPPSRTIEAKRKALALYASNINTNVSKGPGSLNLQEAMELERQAYLRDKEKQQRILEKKQRLGMPIRGEILTREEREARIWAFMNHKPTESDLEDDDDEDSDDDPASWFDDDQDDGRKGQDIVEPDLEDLSDIIHIDESRIRYSTFYEPRDDGD